jgi:hypothetical protein
MARRTVLLPAAIMAAVLMTCAPALMVVESHKVEAAFPGNNCKIAFSSYDGHDQEINTINVGGGGRSRVTNNVDDIWGLSWEAGSGLTCHPT